MALTDKLTNIANAIREKSGTTDTLTLDAMPNAIAAIETGGGGEVKLEWSGDLPSWCSKGGWDWYFQQYGNKVITSNITNGKEMFAYSNLEEIPFDLNFKEGNDTNVQSMLYSTGLKKVGTIRNLRPRYFQTIFSNSKYLRELPKFDNLDLSSVRGMYDYMYIRTYSFFQYCFSLRKIEKSLLKEMYNEYSTGNMYNNMFDSCAALDEIDGLSPRTGEFTSNQFNTTFSYCYRLKRIVFDTQEDGTPYTAKWKNQTIDLTQYTGWAGYSGAIGQITNYNSGITTEKEITSAKENYNTLKDDPDWWSREFVYSRFNYDSAVELINSLPDTSAYIASNGGTNTVKFYTNAGISTDGGSVSQLTEEEIAVATAKGWTITYGT